MTTITHYFNGEKCFPVTATLLTDDSASNGDYAVHGYIDSHGLWDDHFSRFGTYPDDCGWQLSTIYRDLKHRRWEGAHYTDLPDSISTESLNDDLLTREGDWSVWEPLASVTDALGMTVSIHRPGWITDASWRRVLRLLGAIK